MRTKNPIRLCCEECDTNSGDGITHAEAKRLGWKYVIYVGPVPYRNQHDWRWWSHSGYCPVCYLEELNEAAARKAKEVACR